MPPVGRTAACKGASEVSNGSVRKWMIGVALTALPAAAFASQGPAMSKAPENILPPEPPTVTPAKVPAGSDEVTARAEMAATVQPVTPEVQHWSLADARALAAAVAGISAEGLNPKDYQPGELQAAIAAGPGDALDQAASRSFAWLVEDLRDGRTPMEARRQWFVVDPDPDRYRTGDVMAQALGSHSVAASLAALNPQHPDYAVLKAALAQTSDPAQRKLIMANMDRWRW